MNSITQHLSAESIVAVLRQVRSARRHEVLLIVEGDDDISMFSQSLQLSRDHFVSCNGKENLMTVFGYIPDQHIDVGMIFFRDADCDNIGNHRSGGICLLVSDRYDFEMVVVEGRIFDRILSEFLKRKASASLAASTFAQIVDGTAWLGALRAHSHRNSLSLKFEELDFKFVNHKTLEIDVLRMIKQIYARSRVVLGTIDNIVSELKAIRSAASPLTKICCGKDFLEILSICLRRQHDACSYHEGSAITLGRILRIATTMDDVRAMSLFPLLKQAVQDAAVEGYIWSGAVL
jgi:hypothetical protein